MRRAFRGVKTPRGAVFFGVGALMVCMWLASVAFSTRHNRLLDPEQVRTVAPVLLLAMCVLALVTPAGDKALYFSPGEVNFLFSGPFRHREILLYKLLGRAFTRALTALLVATWLMMYVGSWLPAYVGSLLALVFVDLVTIAVALIGQTVAEHIYTKARKIVLAVVGVSLCVGAAALLSSSGGVDAMSVLRRVQDSWAGRIGMAPFNVLAWTIAAESLYPEMIAWASVGVLMNAALVVVVLRLDANYLEAAATISGRLYKRIETARRTGMVSGDMSGRRHRSLPMFPRMRGVGTLAWRQTTTIMRGAWGVMLVLFAMMLGGGVFGIAGGPSVADNPVVISGMAWICILVPMMIRFDFRNDIDSVEVLKGLPLGSAAIVMGQMAPAIAIVSGVELVLIGSAAAALPGIRVELLVALAFVVPLNLILFTVENALFLLFPYRWAGAGFGDFQIFGKHMVLFFVRGIIWLMLGGLAAAAGAAAYFVLGRSWPAGIVAAWIVLTAEGVGLVPVVGWTYRRFDPSIHTPA